MPGPGLLVSGEDGSRAWFDELVLLAQDLEDSFARIPLPYLGDGGGPGRKRCERGGPWS